jgi:hypothetical protein
MTSKAITMLAGLRAALAPGGELVLESGSLSIACKFVPWAEMMECGV